jgi:zinc D-Ala-D-Ala carboxypeptidase
MLSAHFALDEMTISQTATRLDLDNTPDERQTDNLRRLCETLEQVRSVLGKPITINSGFRSAAVNQAVGGVPTSEHCDGRAADIICPAYGNPYHVAVAIANAGIEFNQLIIEYGRWVHISVPPLGEAPKMVTLTYRKGKPTARGLVA